MCNKIYKSFNLGLLKVLDVSFKKLADIPFSEIRKSGFRSIQDFKDGYEEVSRRVVDFQAESAVKIESNILVRT